MVGVNKGLGVSQDCVSPPGINHMYLNVFDARIGNGIGYVSEINVCVWIRYIKHTPIHFLIRVNLYVLWRRWLFTPRGHPCCSLYQYRSHQVQSSLWGGDSDWSCIGSYRSVLKKVDTAACIDTGLNTEQMKAPGTGSDT